MIAPPPVGARWGERFDLLEARDGGPGRVTYLARDRAFGTDVELWWIVPGVHRDQAADWLVRGAATLRSLVHPAVRALVDTGFAEGTTWAAYEVAAPGVLPRERSPLPTPAVAAWARAVAAGLSAAHQIGWCHGRLVPADVVKLQGTLRVGGLGLWMMAEPVSIAAWSAHAAYLAPEVVAGWGVGPASDVWGVAAAVAALSVGTERAIDERALLVARSPQLAAALADALVPDPRARIGLAELVQRLDAVAAAAGPEAFAPTPSRAVPLSSLPLHLLNPAAAAAAAPAPLTVSPPSVPPPAVAPLPLPPTPAMPAAPAMLGAADAHGPRAPRHRTNPPPIPPGARRATGPQRRLTPPLLEAVAPGQVAPVTPRPPPPPPSGRHRAFSISQVAGAVERAKLSPGQAISLRPGGPRPTAPMAAVAPGPEHQHERPKAFLRPLSELSTATVEAGAIGWMAPPRELTPQPRRRWVPVVGVMFGAVAAATIAIVVATQTGVDDSGPAAGSGDEAAGGASDRSGPVGSAGPPRLLLSPVEPARGCTDETLALGDLCIDPYEAPGRGRVPATGLTARDAADACAARGLRLCTPTEWRQACAGSEQAAAEAGACNLGTSAVVVAGGAFERCVSAIEAHDLLGNVAEWVADGTALGASASDGGAGRCDGPPRTAAADATFADVGYRCCGDR